MTQWLTDLIASAGWHAPLYYLLGFLLAALLPFIPSALVSALGGTAFGFWPAVAYGVVGLGIGSFAALTLSRFLGKPLLLRYLRPQAWRAWEDVLGIRSVPLWGLVFFVLNIDYAVVAAGLTGLPLRGLWLAAVAARLPWLVLSAWFGDAFLQSERSIVPALLVAALLLVMFNMLRPRLRRWLVTLAERRAGPKA